MLVMLPPKKPGRDKPNAAKSNPPKKKPQRTGKAINVWVPDQLHAALESFLDAQRIRPKITDVVEVALQEFLAREGHWPLKPGAEPSDE